MGKLKKILNWFKKFFRRNSPSKTCYKIYTPHVIECSKVALSFYEETIVKGTLEAPNENI